jgi:AraC-like DNA-binding protein
VSLLPRVRAATLFNYIEVASSAGLDPYCMLRGVQIDPALLSEPENWLSARRVADLLEQSARQSCRDDFALMLAACRAFPSLGPISLLLKHQATLKDIIGTLREYRAHVNDVFGVVDAVSDGVAVVEWTVAAEFSGAQIESLVCALGYRALTGAMAQGWLPECVHFRFNRPTEIQSYQRYFKCDLQFGAQFNGLSFNASQLETRSAAGDPAMALHAERLLRLVPATADTLTDRAKHALYLLLPSGQASLYAIARNLGLGARSLQRELDNEGTSFATLLNETRRELAQRYLVAKSQPLAEVAHLLGYATPGSFSRWFAHQFGMTPQCWRSQEKN